jgi:hypothetical protein
MADNQEAVQFFDNFLFPKIFQSFRMAVQHTRLIIAFLAVVTICFAGWVMDLTRTVVTSPDIKLNHGVRKVVVQGRTELQVYLAYPDQVQSYIEQNKEKGGRKGVFSTLWGFSAEKFSNIVNSLFAFNLPAVRDNAVEYARSLGWAIRFHGIYCVVFFAIKLAVISIAGGAICRISALEFAQGEKPGLIESLSFSIKKFPSFLTAPLMPAALVLGAGIFLFALGLITNIAYLGELTAGLFMPLMLFAGVLIAVGLIWIVAGFNLMYPAIAYEGTGCFDAISRSLSYVAAKPWRMGFYTVIAAVYGLICYIFVRFFAFLVLWSAHWFLRLGVFVETGNHVNKLTTVWPEPQFANLAGPLDLTNANWSQSICGLLMYIWSLAVLGVVVAFVVSFFFSANSIIYALMRKWVDNTQLSEVYTPSQELDSIK